MRLIRVTLACALAAAVLAALAGVAGGSTPPGTKGNPIKAKATTTLGFAPAKVTVTNTKTGKILYFRNVDKQPHNALATKKISGKPAFKSGSPTTGNFTLKLKPGLKGTFAYICEVHPFMKGTLVVK